MEEEQNAMDEIGVQLSSQDLSVEDFIDTATTSNNCMDYYNWNLTYLNFFLVFLIFEFKYHGWWNFLFLSDMEVFVYFLSVYGFWIGFLPLIIFFFDSYGLDEEFKVHLHLRVVSKLTLCYDAVDIDERGLMSLLNDLTSPVESYVKGTVGYILRIA